jgi:hypothetical protein
VLFFIRSITKRYLAIFMPFAYFSLSEGKGIFDAIVYNTKVEASWSISVRTR